MRSRWAWPLCLAHVAPFFPSRPPNVTEESHAEFMGFSVRNARWRYTVWLPWDGEKLNADWTASAALAAPRELYDYDPYSLYNPDRADYMNRAYETKHQATVNCLHRKLMHFFRDRVAPPGMWPSVYGDVAAPGPVTGPHQPEDLQQSDYVAPIGRFWSKTEERPSCTPEDGTHTSIALPTQRGRGSLAVHCSPLASRGVLSVILGTASWRTCLSAERSACRRRQAAATSKMSNASSLTVQERTNVGLADFWQR